MSYAIGRIVYGVTIERGSDLLKAIDAVFNEDWTAREKLGIEPLYEGVAAYVFGVRLGSIDECSDVDLETLPKPDGLTFEKWVTMRDKLPESVRVHLPKPKWRIVWERS